MKQKPFTAAQKKQLMKQSEAQAEDQKPIVKFFCPWGAATWLVSELSEDGDTMFGLCDLGQGSPELGYVSLTELSNLKGPFGLTIERDLHFSADKSLVEYADEARETGRISA